MKHYYDRYEELIATSDALWIHTYLYAAVVNGSIFFNNQTYYLLNEDGVNIHELKVEAEKNNQEFDPYSVGLADFIREDFMNLYRLGGRELFFEALRCKRAYKGEMQKYIMKNKEEGNNERK